MAKAKKDIEENVGDEKESRTSVYEIGYVMVPNIAEESLGVEITSLKDMLTENGAVFISDEYPKMIELAYEMSRSINNKKQKFKTGYFGWVKFECSTSEAKTIKSILEKDERLVRFLLIKTVRENTMSVKRTYSKQDNGKKRIVSKVEESEKINEETIDKEIDALVV